MVRAKASLGFRVWAGVLVAMGIAGLVAVIYENSGYSRERLLHHYPKPIRIGESCL